MALCGKYHFRGPVHSQQRAAQVHQTPGIATSSVRFLTAEDCFPGEPQAAAQQGFLSGATHHIPSTSHPSHLSHSSSPLHCAGSPVCGTAWEIRSGEWTGLEITWEGGDCFSNLVAWSAVHLEQSRLEVRGRGGEGMVWKPCQHSPQGDGPSVLSCGCGILQTICLRVDFWCGGFIFSWGNAETDANCKGKCKCAEKHTVCSSWWNWRARGTFSPPGLSRFLVLTSACDPEPTTVLLHWAP